VIVLIAIAPVCIDAAALPAPLETPAEAIDATVDASTMLKAPLMKLRREVSALVTVSPATFQSFFMSISGGLLLSTSKESSLRAGYWSCTRLRSLDCDSDREEGGCPANASSYTEDSGLGPNWLQTATISSEVEGGNVTGRRTIPPPIY
jgi:hypothetical protein